LLKSVPFGQAAYVTRLANNVNSLFSFENLTYFVLSHRVTCVTPRVCGCAL